MPVSAGYREHIADLFRPFGPIVFKRFFGGVGLYHKDKLFGFLMSDRVYLKTNEETRVAYREEKSDPFTFKNASGETIEIAYYELPARLHDDTDELALWVREAQAIAKAPNSRKRLPAKGKLPRDLPILEPRAKPKPKKK